MSFSALKTLVNVGKNISNEYTVPVFKSVDKNKEFETRIYEKTRFIVYKYRSIDTRAGNGKGKKSQEEDPVMKNVWRLMKYTQGENEQKVNMKLYMPVFVHIETLSEANPDGQIEVEVKIMVALPPEYQCDKDEPPKPNDLDLYFEVFEQFKCYVRNFSGFADEDTFKAETEKLRESVKQASLGTVETKCFCISYDPPYKLINRRNEVIIISV